MLPKTMIRVSVLFFVLSIAHAFELPQASTQCVVGMTEDWDSSHVHLQFYEKRGNRWQPITGKWPGRVGKKGLAWGLGLHPLPGKALIKQEGDSRAPAGVFRIGGVWGNEATIQKHPSLSYRQVTTRDLWIEDPTSPFYNQHMILPHEPRTPWEKRQQMKQNDAAHALKLLIAHNAPPSVVPGAGSSIFFHIWRAQGAKPTAGCTTMSEENLRQLISLINPTSQPLFVLLPRLEYEKLKTKWKLP